MSFGNLVTLIIPLPGMTVSVSVEWVWTGVPAGALFVTVGATPLKARREPDDWVGISDSVGSFISGAWAATETPVVPVNGKVTAADVSCVWNCCMKPSEVELLALRNVVSVEMADAGIGAMA